MTTTEPPWTPPFCPNPACRFHRHDKALWRFVRNGFYGRLASPRRIQRLRCVTCRRQFSTQTFHPTYWLKRPELQVPIFHRLVACSGYRQIARESQISPQTVLTHGARLGRHCMLFHETLRPQRTLEGPAVLDSFESFEYSQYHPTGFHLFAGQKSHFLHGFTDSEKRRSGRMTRAQKRKRARLEERYGRPDPRSSEKEVAALLGVVAPHPQALELHTDEHPDYPRAFRRVRHLRVEHRTISSRAARNPQNPLFPVNLLDLLIRHSGANHKRETIAFSKRRQSAIERLWVFTVWRNYVKSLSERRQGETPAMKEGVTDRKLTVEEVLERRLFPSRIRLPERWASYYWREITTRMIPNGARHAKIYAF